MPELPEVETVVRGLRTSLPGRSIVAVRLGKTDFMEDPAALAALLPGQRIEAVERIGKFIRLRLATGANARKSAEQNPAVQLNLMVHLGMTGRLVVRTPHDPIAPHTHGFFDLDDGRELRYTDIRRFGQIRLVAENNLAQFHEHLGREPLEVSREEFARLLDGRRARIKSLLLDQRVFRGIGNIYADESLWRARIHPMRLAANLSVQEMANLRDAIQKVLRIAIDMHGSSISDFVDSDGKPGSYQQEHRVYGHTGDPCVRCRAVIRRIIVAGRSSHFCPSCQPTPRARSARRIAKPKTKSRRPAAKSKAKGK